MAYRDSNAAAVSLHGPNPTPSSVTQPEIPCVAAGEGVAFSSLGDWESGKPPDYFQSLFRPDVVESIEASLDELSKDLRELSLKIHDHPELGFQEKYAHDTLTAFMSSRGFKVTPHYLGLETAWRASYQVGSGGRTLGFNSEMDALPGIGHACGHNLIAIVGVGAALGVASAMKKHDISGTIVLLGTPAEEGGQGKVKLIDAGGYREMAACLMAHPGPGGPRTAGTGSSLAVQSLYVTYYGHTAHAAGAPWEGKNALDAAFLAYSAISVLRQQIKPTHRVHGIVKGRDWAANIIPDYAYMKWLVRAPTWAETQVLRERVKKCFEAAALATDCRMEYSEDPGTFDVRQNLAIADEFTKVSERYGVACSTAVQAAVGGSTDFGNVTYEVPALHPTFAIPTEPNGGNHTALFTQAAATMKAHEAALTTAKTLAIVGARILIDDDFAAQVTKDFKEGKTTGTVS